MHWAYCPLPGCTLINDETVQVGVLFPWEVGQLQFLDQALGCSVGMAQSTGLHRGYTGCHRYVGTGTGATSGTAGVCGFGVIVIAGATGGGCSSCAGLVGADSVAEMHSLTGACSVAVVTAGVVSVGLTLHSQRCHLMQ